MKPTLFRAMALVMLAGSALSGARVSARSSGPAGTSTVYLSVLDESGKPVKDMRPDEIMLREDQQDVQILSVGPAQDPLQVVFLVDTSGSAVQLTQDIRNGVTAFIKQLHAVRSDAAIELIEFGQASVAAAPFTTDETVLLGALQKLVGKPDADAVLLEGLMQATTDLSKRPSPRRAVVSLNTDPSRELIGDTSRIKDGFRKSVAELWALTLHVSNITIRAGKNASAAATANLGATRNAVLSQLATQTGGIHGDIDTPSGIEGTLKQYADALTYQYEIVYRAPNKSGKVVQVGTTRSGVKLHASGFAPQ